jgi:hypothetical protein
VDGNECKRSHRKKWPVLPFSFIVMLGHDINFFYFFLESWPAHNKGKEEKRSKRSKRRAAPSFSLSLTFPHRHWMYKEMIGGEWKGDNDPAFSLFNSFLLFIPHNRKFLSIHIL